jgi:hypothetical protein
MMGFLVFWSQIGFFAGVSLNDGSRREQLQKYGALTTQGSGVIVRREA